MRRTMLAFLLFVMLFTAVIPAMAQERGTLPEQLAADGRFGTLLAAVEAADLVDALSGEGPFTLLAPTDDAFAAALEYLGVSAEDLLADTETLTEVLTYHVIPGRYFFRNLTSGPTVETLQGDSVTFNLDTGVFTAEGVQILDVDNVASNGVFHVAEGVLLPPDIREAAEANRASIRVAHLSPDAGLVDVYVNDHLAAEAVGFSAVTGWFEVPSGAINVAVVPTGEEPSGAALRNVQPGTWTTVAAIGSVGIGNLEIAFLDEDTSELADGQARVNVFHAIYGAPAVDILANGAPLIINLAYPGTNGDNDGYDSRAVGAGTYTIQVVATGTTEPVLLETTLVLNAGDQVFVSAAGSASLPQLIASTTPAGS